MPETKNSVRCEMNNISEPLTNCAITANNIACDIYSRIRNVGSEKQSPANALLSLVESMKEAEELYRRLLELAKIMRQKGSTNAQ